MSQTGDMMPGNSCFQRNKSSRVRFRSRCVGTGCNKETVGVVGKEQLQVMAGVWNKEE